ncbi:MAG: hypothetical protein ACJ749_20280, partial [Flavisolibacter sp.]
MKRKILLFFVMAPFVSAVYGQKTQQIRAYAITGAQKGQSNWTEVRLIDIITGEEVQSVYQSKSKVDVLNARTGNPVAKKQLANDNAQSPGRMDALPGVNTKAAA